ncbi:16031_t:CDS:2, partial [Gigaspora margarita]
NQVMNTRHLNTYYCRGSTILTSEQIETIRVLKGKVSKYKIIGDFHINENRVDDRWENHERQQQIIQSDSLNYSSSNLHMITTLSNKEIKKRSSKSQSKSVRISDSIPTNNSNIVTSTLNETEKI